MNSKNKNIVQKLLQIGVFLTFLGHGMLALQMKESWIPYLTFLGISVALAKQLLLVIGIMDILVAISILIKPMKPIVLWAVIWAVATALIRPIVGEPIWDFVERGSNFMVPLALYFMLNEAKR